MLKNSLNDKWESILEECLTEYGFTTFRLTIDRRTDIKSTGVLMGVTVEGRKDREFKIGYLIMKAIGDSEDEIKAKEIDSMFKTESFFYNRVRERFDSMQRDLATIDRFKLPLCYKAADEYVLVEDLVMRNFAVRDGRKTLDFDHVSFALVELARFHTLSLALKGRDRETFDSFASSLRRGFFTYPMKFTTVFDDVLNRCLNALPGGNLKVKFEKHCRLALENSDKLTADSTHHVICHGDFTTQNIFFAYDQDDEPSELAILDYQLCTVGSPVMDVLCLLLTSSSSETIRHYEMLLDIYYDSMKLFLKKFQCLSEDCYPRSVFKKHSSEYFSHAFAQAVFTIAETHEDVQLFSEKINELANNLNDLELL